MDGWLEKISNFFKDLVIGTLLAILEVLKDILLWFVEGFLDGVAYVLSLIPAPTFLPGNWLGELIGQLPSFALYVVSNINFGTALLIIGAGFGFRMLRKVFTLFQW
ncbi:MAG: hypothetical protein JNJ51_10010 [Methylobacillus glycogenes]|nr:hypothetical protein [Methylobacillus glycogenes]